MLGMNDLYCMLMIVCNFQRNTRMHVCMCLANVLEKNSRKNSKNCAYFVIVKDTIAVTFLRRIRVIGCLFYYFLFWVDVASVNRRL